MEGRRNPWLILLANALGFAGMVATNWLANAVPIGGQTTGEVSARYSNLFVPAGWAFSIWGVIYILLLLWVILTIVNWRTIDKIMPFRRVSFLFWITCLANAGWIFCWHSLLPGIALIIMLILLLCLVLISEKMMPFRDQAPIWTYLPFEIYLGWICVATIANWAAWLVSMDWVGFLPEAIWTSVMIAAGTGIGVFYVYRKRSVPFGLVLIWALLAIYSRRTADTSVDDSVVELTALVGAGILLLVLSGKLTGLLRVSKQ